MGNIGRDDNDVDFSKLKQLTKKILDSTSALERSEAMFRASYEKSVTPIALLEQDGKIISCNQAFTKMTGYGSEDIKGDSILQFIIDAPTIDATHYLVREILQGYRDHYHVEKKIKTKDGGYKYARISVSCAFDGRNQIIFVIGVFEDITEITELKNRIKELEGQLAKKE